ncbi:conserved hypothetical protein [Chthoniobacter flavus Ellin428]|uniref:Suppressor of fused-like domain-containing protein n=1 Tax=Chthoniobacter flavus Ellin428 TaxID=497964 RepID=B4CVJ3_9BACT|nr:suppressor of fused domain protein [Chthoniobacter flavus]EDY21435.1 conserved hypothetical protein [Chthoniobacter flavus Ellin428]TCO95393.1 suppressor of fused protein SUFU [Chthoniobacter flavus]
MSNDDATPGWDAINRTLKPIYGEQEPLHWGTIMRFSLGGNDPLDGISAYRRTDPVPHWHFVTFGFSELYAKEAEDTECSGYGFELTFRLRTETFDEPPSTWVLNFLQNLARYVFSSGNVFDAGHYMDLNGPIALGVETKIRAIAIAQDSELGRIQTPNGELTFLQVVGITLDELFTAKAWDTSRLLETIQPHLPLWITDLTRSSFTDDLSIACTIQAGIERDGSSTAFLFVGATSWKLERPLLRSERLVLTLGANGVRNFVTVLPNRIPFGRSLDVASREGRVHFAPADECAWNAMGEEELVVHLTAAAAHALVRTVIPKQGTYMISQFPNFVVQVVKSEIKDTEGKVVEVIG